LSNRWAGTQDQCALTAWRISLFAAFRGINKSALRGVTFMQGA